MSTDTDGWRGIVPFVQEDVPANREYYTGLAVGAAWGIAVTAIVALALARFSPLVAGALGLAAVAGGAGYAYRPL